MVDDSEKRLLDDIEKLMKRKLQVMPLPEVKTSPGQTSDPFFYMPYQAGSVPKTDASAGSSAGASEVKRVGIVSAKPAVGALLGGFKKK